MSKKLDGGKPTTGCDLQESMPWPSDRHSILLAPRGCTQSVSPARCVSAQSEAPRSLET